jgi:predicted phosphodiesterase
MYNNLKRLEKELLEHYIHLQVETDRLYFTDLSDIHIGHRGFDSDTFQHTLDVIKNTPNFYVFLGGDSINHANKGSKSSQYEEDMTPREQIKGKYESGKLVRKGLVQYLEPIRDRIIGKIDGNHDGTRAQEFNDMSPMEWLTDILDIPYLRDLALIQFSLANNAYTHYIHHISGSTGKKINLNKLQEKGEEYRVDVIWGEHTHRRHYGSELYVDIDLRNRKPVIKEQLYINASTFLSWSGYAKTKGYRINKTGVNIVEMSGVRGARGIKVYDGLDSFLCSIKKGGTL